MNLQFYLEKLYSSEEFKKFKRENPYAFLCSAFFIIDLENIKNPSNKQHFDFYISGKAPSQLSIAHSNEFEISKDSINKNSAGKSGKADFRATTTEQSEDKSKGKMFSFQLEGGIKKVPVEMFGEKIPKEISTSCDFDFEEIKEMITNKLKQEKIKNKIQKILLSLQKLKDNDYLICTVFISALGLLKVQIDLSKKQITEFEKKSFMDMMKIVKRKKS